MKSTIPSARASAQTSCAGLGLPFDFLTMKTHITMSAQHPRGDTFSVFRHTNRGVEWSRGPIRSFSVLARNKGESAFWLSPAGMFISSGLRLGCVGIYGSDIDQTF
jgi:hypothetical protein